MDIEILKRLIAGEEDKKYAPFGPCPPDLLAEYKQIANDLSQAEAMCELARAKKRLWWAKIEAHTKMYEQSWRIDTDSGILLIAQQENNKEN